MRCLVTGCAGFIGSSLTERLLARGDKVLGYDNFSTGRERFLLSARQHPGFRLVRADLLDARTLTECMRQVEFVYHLAANADVRFGTEHPRKDLEQNTLATHNVLEAMRASGVARIAFTSSGAVYGEALQVPTPEDASFPVQTSLYGASKVAAEALIAAYCAGFGFQSYIFRLVSILGERYGHGHVLDFYRQLRADPARLRVLGDGRQRKSYLYVHDCVEAMLTAVERAHERVNIFNLGCDASCEVKESVGWICRALGVAPQVEYGSGDRGWPGDNPLIILETSRIRALGWSARLDIRAAVLATLEYLRANPDIVDARR
ncbi:MAG TPA: NAD-dependent epimerase/dehydratase family protein [Steroidobacteraceae bacterium]